MVEAHHGAVEAHHGAIEAHHGAVEAHHGAREAHHGTVELAMAPWRLTIVHVERKFLLLSRIRYRYHKNTLIQAPVP
jgi:hypothetical protein